MQTPYTCLLIDDDDDDREIFGLALHEADPRMNCVMAYGGIKALEILRDASFTPAFIFLDLNMPGMSGRDCLKEIRKIERLNNVPVIVYSTSIADRDIRETKAAGATDYISKPTSIGELTEQLLVRLTR